MLRVFRCPFKAGWPPKGGGIITLATVGVDARLHTFLACRVRQANTGLQQRYDGSVLPFQNHMAVCHSRSIVSLDFGRAKLPLPLDRQHRITIRVSNIGDGAREPSKPPLLMIYQRCLPGYFLGPLVAEGTACDAALGIRTNTPLPQRRPWHTLRQHNKV